MLDEENNVRIKKRQAALRDYRGGMGSLLPFRIVEETHGWSSIGHFSMEGEHSSTKSQTNGNSVSSEQTGKNVVQTAWTSTD
jgi:hypothetical protein